MKPGTLRWFSVNETEDDVNEGELKAKAKVNKGK